MIPTYAQQMTTACLLMANIADELENLTSAQVFDVTPLNLKKDSFEFTMTLTHKGKTVLVEDKIGYYENAKKVAKQISEEL